MEAGCRDVPESSRLDGLRAVYAADETPHGEAVGTPAKRARRDARIHVRWRRRSGVSRRGRCARDSARCAGHRRLTIALAAGTVAWMPGPDITSLADRLDGDLAREVASATAGSAAAAEGELY